MALRFRKRIKLCKGLSINLSKKSIGFSAGTKGAHLSLNSKGRRTKSVGIPGTGISYTTEKGGNKKMSSNSTYQRPHNKSTNNNDNGVKWYTKTGWIIALLILFFPVGIYLMWKYAKWNTIIKAIVSGMFAIFLISELINPSEKVVESTEVQTVIESTIEISEIESITEEIETTEEINTTETEITTDETIIEQQTQEESQKTEVANTVVEENAEKVWIASSGKGKVYHKDPNCSGMVSPTEISLEEAQKSYKPCDKCCN